MSRYECFRLLFVALVIWAAAMYQTGAVMAWPLAGGWLWLRVALEAMWPVQAEKHATHDSPR